MVSHAVLYNTSFRQHFPRNEQGSAWVNLHEIIASCHVVVRHCHLRAFGAELPHLSPDCRNFLPKKFRALRDLDEEPMSDQEAVPQWRLGTMASRTGGMSRLMLNLGTIQLSDPVWTPTKPSKSPTFQRKKMLTMHSRGSRFWRFRDCETSD
eukprot:m.369406 g.369406  ORF g.369406 m.369406 type:complete len:152 (+) comp16675_c0_seq26:34-489(+)